MCQDAPDYTPMANASEHAANVAMALGMSQQAQNAMMYADMSPAIKRIYTGQADAMDEQMEQAEGYYNYNVDTFRPLEKGLVADAESFNTKAYRDQLASRAAADAGLAFNRTRQANERAMRSMGVNPNSGASRALNSQAAMGLAANRAQMMNNTRQQAEQIGYARKLDAAGLGRNLPGASTGAYSGAAQAGSAGAGAATTFMNSVNSGMTGANGTIMQGQQIGVQGLGNVLNAQATYAGQTNAGIGSAVGTAAGLAIGMSDRRAKENIIKVGVEETTGLNLYEFNYIGPNKKRYRGVMADEVYEKRPDAVFIHDNGFMYVDYGKLGFDMQEVA